jgi:effector-associated domain 2 (EAD2)-containing protein
MNRTRPNLGTLRAGMYESVTGAFAEADIPWEECFRQDGGDSILVLVDSKVPKGAFAGDLLRALLAALRAHNETHDPEERIRLRMALHAGEVAYDDHGVNGPAIIHASRLCDAPTLKQALAESSGELAVIASDWFYEDVIRHNPAYEPTAYRRVPVQVKETNAFGWIRLPGQEPPAEDRLARKADPLAKAEEPEFAAPEEPVFVVLPLRPGTQRFFQVIDALEQIACMRHEHTRAEVVEALSFSGMIRYHPGRRAHIMSILRSCTDFDDGVLQLAKVIVDYESNGSEPLRRLLSLLASRL